MCITHNYGYLAYAGFLCICAQCDHNSNSAQVHEEIGRFPLIIRPAFTLGGTGGGIAYNMEEYIDIVGQGLAASMTNQVRTQEIAQESRTSNNGI